MITLLIKYEGKGIIGNVGATRGYRLFGDLGVAGTTYRHWIAYLKQYIEAAPPTNRMITLLIRYEGKGIIGNVGATRGIASSATSG